jgi:hypothetical protein
MKEAGNAGIVCSCHASWEDFRLRPQTGLAQARFRERAWATLPTVEKEDAAAASKPPIPWKIKAEDNAYLVSLRPLILRAG